MMYSKSYYYSDTVKKSGLLGVLRVPILSLLVLHAAWGGVCWYMEQNASMAYHILLAPIPEPIELHQL
jgi:uncharacterized protein involved in cysteine biosynthesis